MLHTLTIAQAHDKLRSKEVSAEDLVKASIARIEAVDENVHAIVHQHFDRALEKAKKIDSVGVFDHPLTGIPYLAKDVFCEEGVPTTACSTMLRNPASSSKLTANYTPPFNSTTTNRLNAVGAISIGKTNTDEFTMGASTETSCYGPTRNPWDTTRVAGGSSGGSAAAVAADMSIFAMGTDTGGSIRQPAGFCGCTGIRTTYGRTSRFGVMSMASSLDTIGPFAKNIEDLAMILQTIAGRDPLDGTTGDMPVPDYRAALTGDVKGLKIGLPQEYFTDGMHPDVEASVIQAAETLKSMGAELVELSLPHTKYAVATYYVITPCEVSSNMARYDGIRYGHSVDDAKDLVDYYCKTRSEGFGAEVKRRIMIGTYALSAGYFDAYYRQAQKVRTILKQEFDEAFQKVDVILSPTSPTPSFTVGAHADDPVAMYLEDVFLCAQPMAGIPALALPCGFTKATTEAPALPIGLQLMGKQWDEATILRTAHAYEQATQWHEMKPSVGG